MKETVTLTGCRTYKQASVKKAIIKGLQPFGGIDSFVKSGHAVLIKPNMLSPIILPSLNLSFSLSRNAAAFHSSVTVRASAAWRELQENRRSLTSAKSTMWNSSISTVQKLS
jgi:hypothetical protein